MSGEVFHDANAHLIKMSETAKSERRQTRRLFRPSGIIVSYHTMRIEEAEPYPFAVPPEGRVALLMIDWQRDFLDVGGFGHSLGNKVAPLRAALPAAAAVLHAARRAGLFVVHTLEAHRPDLSDLVSAKKRRCPAIGEVLDGQVERGRLLIAGEPGNAIVPEVAPVPGELILHKPGKGAFYSTTLHTELRARGITHLLVTGVTTEVPSKI